MNNLLALSFQSKQYIFNPRKLETWTNEHQQQFRTPANVNNNRFADNTFVVAVVQFSVAIVCECVCVWVHICVIEVDIYAVWPFQSLCMRCQSVLAKQPVRASQPTTIKQLFWIGMSIIRYRLVFILSANDYTSMNSFVHFFFFGQLCEYSSQYSCLHGTNEFVEREGKPILANRLHSIQGAIRRLSRVPIFPLSQVQLFVVVFSPQITPSTPNEILFQLYIHERYHACW